MAQPINNARDAWAVFNGHYHKAALLAGRPRRGKREQQRLRRQIQRDWARIRIDHIDDHVDLKSELRDAIRRTTAASRLVDRAMDTITVEGGRYEAADTPVPAELYEDLISAEMRVLSAMKDLTEVERRIGNAAAFLMAHADREIAHLKRNIMDTGEHIASLRRDEEHDYAGRHGRRSMHQRKWRPNPPPGGRIWYGDIADRTLAHVGFCLAGDQHNRIVDRLVTKDVWFTEHPELWTEPGYWIGDPRDPTAKMPSEVHIMGRLGAARQKMVVQMRGWHMAPEELMYRVCPQYFVTLIQC